MAAPLAKPASDVQQGRRRLRRSIPLALALTLLAASLLAYGFFAGHVLARGDAVIQEKWSSPEARAPLAFAGTAILGLAGSGILGLLALRGLRVAPLAGLGLPLACAGALGLLAFEAGPGAFTAAAGLLACFVLAALAAIAWGRPSGDPAPWRVVLGSWMTLGTLATLLVLAFGALGPLESHLAWIPWSAILAATALLALMRALSRHVAAAGQDPSPRPLRHEQVRTPFETAAIRSVADRLHPFIEQGRGGADYDSLTAELAARAGVPAPARVPGLAGPRLPPLEAALAGILRMAALALPIAFLLPGAWAVAVPLLAGGLVLPAAVSSLLAPAEPMAPAWWLLGATLAAAGAVLSVGLVTADVAQAAAGATLALPYLLLAYLASKRAVPEEIAFLRAAHARRLAERRALVAAQGGLTAAAFLALPALLAGMPLLIGIDLPQVPWQVVAAGVTGGLAWALAGVLAGQAAGRARAALDGAQARQEALRRAQHSRFLDQLEAT